MKTVRKYHPDVSSDGNFPIISCHEKQSNITNFVSFSVIQECKAKPLMTELKGDGTPLVVPKLAAIQIRHQRFNSSKYIARVLQQ